MDRAICDAALALIEKGFTIREAARFIDVDENNLRKKLNNDPEVQPMFARAHDASAHAFIDRLWDIANDPNLDSKDKRVRIDTGVKIAAKRWPHYYGDSLRLITNDAREFEELTAEEIAVELIALARAPQALQLPPPTDIVDADYTEL